MRPLFSSFTFALGLAACGGNAAQPSTPPPAPADPATASTPAPAGTVDDPTATQADSSTSSSDAAAADKPAAPPQPSFVELCNRMCERVTKKCSETAAESCRMNCTQYEHPPAGCDVQIRTALECAARADDLTCVNIAPESCAPDFRRVVACASGKPEGAMPEDPTKVPDDWGRFESASFVAPMPKGVTEKSGAPEPTYAVTSGEATYQVRILPPPKDPPTQKNLVRVAMNLVGKCNKNLKLFSMVERPGRITIRLQAQCPANQELQGFLVLASGKMFVLEVFAPKDAKIPRDPFFFGFEPR